MLVTRGSKILKSNSLFFNQNFALLKTFFILVKNLLSGYERD